jgi:hypothetical protein
MLNSDFIFVQSYLAEVHTEVETTLMQYLLDLGE